MIMQKNEKKGCLIALALLIPGIVCIFIGIEYDIYILRTMGYIFPAYGGSMFANYANKNGIQKWSVKKHVIFSISCILISIAFTLIMYGRLW